MEMMELNEELMELQLEGDEHKIAGCKLRIADWGNKLYNDVQHIMEHYCGQITAVDLLKIKDYYFKKKYLLRIQERLARFASRS